MDAEKKVFELFWNLANEEKLGSLTDMLRNVATEHHFAAGVAIGSASYPSMFPDDDFRAAWDDFLLMRETIRRARNERA